MDSARTKETTVRQTLLDISARLRDREVVDADGKVVFFCEMQESFYRWDPDDIRSWREGFERLESRYRVIRMYVGKRKE